MRQKLKKTKKNWGNLMWTFRYTHVEENNDIGIMECLVSTNIAPEAGVEVQKFAKHVVGDNSMCFIH